MSFRRYGRVWLPVTAVLACAVLLTSVVRRPDNLSPHTEVQDTGVSATVAATYRIVGVWNGKLAVFLPGTATPERVYEVWVSALPAEEQARLHTGVTVGSRRELLALLEDYSG